jgi:hypothetical protein
VLGCAQACFLPIPREGKAEFNTEQRQGIPLVEEMEPAGLNLVLLIQVPLKRKRLPTRGSLPLAAAAPGAVFRGKRRKSDVEEAVIGHGEVEGPFTEIDGLDIERDERYPVRVTVQFYKATSNGVISEEDVNLQPVAYVYQMSATETPNSDKKSRALAIWSWEEGDGP